MNVLVTGASGFIGKNLLLRLSERRGVNVITVSHERAESELAGSLGRADAVIHLAGVNRPERTEEFALGNAGFTELLCNAVNAKIAAGGSIGTILYASSIHAELENDYGRSKRAAESALRKLQAETGCPICIFRLPNVFGKWCRPNYNSVVATFCHNLTHGRPLEINAAEAKLRLVYVDDVVAAFMNALDRIGSTTDAEGFARVEPEYPTTVGELAELLQAMAQGREKLLSEDVGVGLRRALYATYMSYLPPQRFSYAIPAHSDPRGTFSEVLKTQAAGQFSFFTAHPGVTRGGHYHHTKCEKFLVLKGVARFRFRHMLTGESHELFTDGSRPEVVDTVPGWTHDITNAGNEEMIVMLWASENFDRANPDTFAQPL